MRKSTLLRDLAGVLEQYLPQLQEAGFQDWVRHLRHDITDLRTGSEMMQQHEPPLPAIESLAGSIPDLTGGLSSEDYVRKLRAGEP